MYAQSPKPGLKLTLKKLPSRVPNGTIKTERVYVKTIDVGQKLIATKKRVHEFNRRAREARSSGTATKEQIELRIEFWGARCWVCSGPYKDVDHVIPLERGGSNWPANLRPICKSCDSTKGTKPYTLFRPTIIPCPLP